MTGHRWIDDVHLDVDGTRFSLMGSDDRGDGTILLLKPRYMVQAYLDRTEDLRGSRIFEAGIYRGGSTAFLSALLDPEKLVAIDLSEPRNEWLDRWLTAQDRTDRVHLHHGVDQSDRPTLERILDDEFGDAPLDLVIDDASHLLGPTLATFNVLFPRLREGGLYIIEDWSSHLTYYRHFSARPDLLARALEERPELVRAQLLEKPELMQRALDANPHLRDTVEAGADAARPDPPPVDQSPPVLDKQMWRLVLRLVLAAGAYPDLLADVRIEQAVAVLRRGSMPIDPATFDIGDYVVNTGI